MLLFTSPLFLTTMPLWAVTGVVQKEEPASSYCQHRAMWPLSWTSASESAPTGATLSSAQEVECEVFSYFPAIFNGRYATTAAAAKPTDSGVPSSRDLAHFPNFLDDLPCLSYEERECSCGPHHPV
jgi:hypothetical protein